MKHEELMLLPQKSRISSSHNGGMTHVIRIHEDISEPSNWSDELDLINGASEQDTIVLDVCSPGGYLDTAMLFHRSLNSCAAHTVAIIGPECASAASVISLSCREWILDDTSSLMIHTSSYSLGGKDTDILEHANFSRGQLKRLYEKVYSGFLSSDDLSDVIKGTPFYFSAEQIADRLDALTEYRNGLPCQCGDPSCGSSTEVPQEDEEDFDDMPTLEDMISSAVTSGIAQYEKSRLAKEAKASKLAEKKPSPRTKKAVEVAEEIKKGFDERLDKALNLGVQSLALRVFPSWLLAKEDIQFYQATETDIVKFNVKEATAYLDNDIKVKWMVSNGSTKDLEKFQGFRPFDVYYGADVDQDTKDYLTPRIVK